MTRITKKHLGAWQEYAVRKALQNGGQIGLAGLSFDKAYAGKYAASLYSLDGAVVKIDGCDYQVEAGRGFGARGGQGIRVTKTL